MSTTTKLEVNLSKKYIPPVDPEEPEEGSEEWCQDHLEDPRCEQYRPVNPDDPTPTPTPTPEPQQDVPNTGYFTSQTDDNHTVVNQSQISAIFFGGFCFLLILAFVLPKLINKINKNRKNHYNLKKAPVFNKFRIASFALAILSLGAGIITAVEAYERSQSLDISATQHLTIDAEIVGTDTMAYGAAEINIPKSTYGYDLYVYSDDNRLALEYNDGYHLDSITEPTTSLPDQYFAVSLTNPESAGATFYPIYDTNKSIGIPLTEQETEAQTITLYYALRSKEGKPGKYVADIQYEVIEHKDLTLEDMSQSICSELEQGKLDYEFGEDIVAKLKDGNCYTKQQTNPNYQPGIDPEESAYICPVNWHKATNTNYSNIKKIYSIVDSESKEEIVDPLVADFTENSCVADYQTTNIKFNDNHDGEIEVPSNIQGDVNDDFSYTFELPAAPTSTDEEEKFLGWSVSEDGPVDFTYDASTESFIPTNEATIYSPDITLHAIWSNKTAKVITVDNGEILDFVYDNIDYQVGDPYHVYIGNDYLIKLDEEGYYNGIITNIFDVPLNTGEQNMPEWGWFGNSINFEPSFKEFTPISTSHWVEGQNIVSNLQNINTSNVRDMSHMFNNVMLVGNNWKQDEGLDLSSWNTDNVVDMSYMFNYTYCEYANWSLILPEGFGSQAVNIEGMFEGMTDLSFTLPTGFGQSAINMNNMFTNSGVYSITFPAGFGQKATDMRGMFATHYLGSLTLPAGFGQSATDMSYMFYDASSLNSLALPAGFGQSATDMNHMFYHASLTSLTLPAGFGQSATDMSYMFYDASLTSLTLPEGYGQSAIDMSFMYYHASSLEHIYVPAGTNWETKTPEATGLAMFMYAKSLPNFSIYRTDISAAHIGDVDGVMGYFTDVCEKDNSCGEVQGQQGQQSEQPPLMSYSPAPNYSYAPISEQSTEESTDESETEKPVSTGEEKKSTKKSDTKSEQTEPLGVEKSVEKASTVDTATIAVIVASFVLVSAGAVIIFLIEKRRNEDEE